MAKHCCLQQIPLIFLLLLLLHIPFAYSAPNITTDQSALLSLKTHDPYGLLQDWTVSSPVCNWTGVTCGPRHRRVTGLNISGIGLTGEIPPQLGNLSFHVSLDMTGNDFTGSIPQELAHLQRLRFLFLGNNSFTSFESFLNSFSNESALRTLSMPFNSLQGYIPESIGNLQNLRLLSLYNNQLSGVIPASLANISSLEALDLSGNLIQGSIPENMGNLHKLNFLNMEENQLTGSIPNIIFNISTLGILGLGYNNLSGTLPDDVCLRLPILKGLYLSENKIHGRIPSSFTACPQLQFLSLSDNNLSGVMPSEIGNLTMLKELYLGHNKLSAGVIPAWLGNLSSLETLNLNTNTLSGKLPSNLCNSLQNLQALYLAENNLDGFLPNSITNCSQLMLLELSGNRFTGSIPDSLGDLRALEVLGLSGNNFTRESTSRELSFVTSLTNCRYLSFLDFSDNPLNGILPDTVGNLSSSLQLLRISGTRINGYIPNEIGNLSGLVTLILHGNKFDGVIPATLGGLHNLQGLDLGDNQLTGPIPKSLCRLNNLAFLNLSDNQLTGPILECLGNMSSLGQMYLNSNNLSSTIPESIWGLQDLLQLDISKNSISGSISPQIGNLKAAIYINLSANDISGDLPSTFQGLQSMINFSLAHNKFQGQIPNSIGSMSGLVTLDISYNNLSGMIPSSLEALKFLQYFNASFNQLSGEIPSGGPFGNFTSQSFLSNSALCGLQRYQVPRCKQLTSKSKLKKEWRLAFIIVPSVAFVLVCILTMIIIRRCRRKSPEIVSDISLTKEIARISYFDLLKSTNSFGDDNLLGKGSFGSVYKGVFRDGTIFAIKVFNLQLEGALRTFDTECEVLHNICHRNLVKVISSCSNQDFKALVLEYMPNGSLDKWLCAKEVVLSLMQRLSIMIDVATALEYLHLGYSTPVVHCDLKPSNVLLDENMMAHVSDFGIAQLLGEEESRTHTSTLATIGYMAPEYGLDGRISTRCDVYSYGIMLLETFTGRQPGDEMFGENMNLKNWVKQELPNGLIHNIIDPNLISSEEEHFAEKISGVSSVLELALCCLADSPAERMNMNEVLSALEKIKNQFMVGLVLDAGIEEEGTRHLQVVDAARASLGLPVVEYTVTDAALQGINLLAGVEAVISHLVVKHFGIPCAHAPALLPFPLTPSLYPKSAAEEIGYTFLPCVLAGLSTAPQYLVQSPRSFVKDCVIASDVDSVILPIDACSGDAALAFASRKRNRPLIIAVEENEINRPQ